MGDLISRQAAIDHLKKRLYETALNSITEHPYYEDLADNRVDVWLNELPSAERRGRWIYDEWIGWCCSECGNQAPFWCISSTQNLTDYCPNCGGRMEV